MKIIYSPNYNIDIGVFGRLHPFDGMKYAKVVEEIRSLPGLFIQAPESAVDKRQVDEFVGEILGRLLSSKRYILRALELPYIPLLPFSVIERRVLDPMRWAVSGTIMAATTALGGADALNLSGGYHHASRHAAGGLLRLQRCRHRRTAVDRRGVVVAHGQNPDRGCRRPSRKRKCPGLHGG